MGCSASGELFFGIYFGEDDPRWPEGEYGREMPDDWDEDEDEDWENWLTKRAGLENPWDDPIVETMPKRTYERGRSYSERQDRFDAAVEIWDAENSDWVDRRDAYGAAKEALVKECPVALITVGHHDYPLKVLVLAGTQVSGSFDGTEVAPDHLLKGMERVPEAEAWCKENGVAWDTPKWLLTGSWG